MTKKALFILWGSICLVLILAALPFMAACAAPTPAPTPTPTPTPAPTPAPTPIPGSEPYVLNVVTFLPTFVWVTSTAFGMLKERIEENSKGELIINWLGGPEVIPATNQGAAVREGVVDMAWVAAALYQRGLLPMSSAMSLTQLSPQEERSGGAIELINEYHSKVGLFYLGRGAGQSKPLFNIWTNKRAETPADLAGQRIGGGSAVAVTFLQSLGVTNVMLAFPELYSALERGVIDGILETSSSAIDNQWYEQVKYRVGPGILRGTINVIINEETWNWLPAHLQQALIDAQMSVERDYEPINNARIIADRQRILEYGIEIIEFSPEDTKWFVETMYEVEWQEEIRRHPEAGPLLKELLSP